MCIVEVGDDVDRKPDKSRGGRSKNCEGYIRTTGRGLMHTSRSSSSRIRIEPEWSVYGTVLVSYIGHISTARSCP